MQGFSPRWDGYKMRTFSQFLYEGHAKRYGTLGLRNSSAMLDPSRKQEYDP
jgi:hypothetical protein